MGISITSAWQSLDLFAFGDILRIGIPWDSRPSFTTIRDSMFGTCSKHLKQIQVQQDTLYEPPSDKPPFEMTCFYFFQASKQANPSSTTREKLANLVPGDSL